MSKLSVQRRERAIADGRLSKEAQGREPEGCAGAGEIAHRG